MTQPATGDLWPNAYGFDIGSAHKALYGSVLLRDGDGVNTKLDFVEKDGIWQSGFNPFAADGQFRTDLKVEQGGTFYDCGAGSTEGPRFGNTFSVKKEHIWQTRQVIRTDVTSEEGTVRFGLAEYSSLSDTLEMDLPLTSTPVKGSENYARKRPKEMEGRIRQAIVYTVDKGGFYTADVFPSLSIEGIEDRNLSPEELIRSIFTWGVSIDPHSGYSHARFRTGPGWEKNPGPPLFSVAPVATAGAGGAVTLVFPAPDGPATPFTYSVKKTEVDTGVITDLTLSGVPTVVAGNVTLSGTGLTAAEDFTFQVHAENAVGGLSISPTSNKITAMV